VAERAVPSFAVAEAGGWVVALDTTLSEELEREGRARDLIRRVQQARKDAGLAVTDRIRLAVPPEAANLASEFHDWIAQETLAEAIAIGDDLKLVGISDGRRLEGKAPAG
jgi:isoleucyl-tRNA synthetase